MQVGLLLNSNNKLCSYSEKYKEILLKNNIPFILIDPNSYSLLEEIKSCTHLLFRHSQGDTDLKIFESIFNIAHRHVNIDCFPNYEMYWQYEDKIREYYLLKCHGFPVIDTHVFWNYNHADKFLKQTNFPVVAKLPKGAASSNVVIVNSIEEGKKIIEQVFNKGVKSKGLNNSSNLTSLRKAGVTNYLKSHLRIILLNTGIIKDHSEYPEWQIQKDSILFQKFLPNNLFDTRVVTFGKRAIAARRFVRKNDFRASGSGSMDTDPEKIDSRCLEIAFTISNKLNFRTMAYDFIYGEDKTPYIGEISYCFPDFAFNSCQGYWDESLTFHPGHTWPQYFQLIDFLHINDLKSI
jgi:hypothetical protein